MRSHPGACVYRKKRTPADRSHRR